MNDRHRARLTIVPPVAPRAPAVPAEHGAHEHPDNGPTEGVVEGEAVAKPMRHGEDPLPDGHPRQDGPDEVRRLLGHAPAAATGAHRPALAGQREEALERAVVAPEPRKAMHEQSTPQKATELALHRRSAVGSPATLRPHARGRLDDEASAAVGAFAVFARARPLRAASPWRCAQPSRAR